MTKSLDCINCGLPMSAREVDLVGEYRSEQVSVVMPGYQCDVCGFKTIHGQQSGEFARLASDALARLLEPASVASEHLARHLEDR